MSIGIRACCKKTKQLNPTRTWPRLLSVLCWETTNICGILHNIRDASTKGKAVSSVREVIPIVVSRKGRGWGGASATLPTDSHPDAWWAHAVLGSGLVPDLS